MVRVRSGPAHEVVEVGHAVVNHVRVAVVGGGRGRARGGAAGREWQLEVVGRGGLAREMMARGRVSDTSLYNKK